MSEALISIAMREAKACLWDAAGWVGLAAFFYVVAVVTLTYEREIIQMLGV